MPVRRPVIVIALVVLVGSLGACADRSGEIERLGRASTTTATTTTTRRTDPGSTTSTASRGIRVTRALATCGPADGPWIEVTVTTARTETLVATLVVAGEDEGGSAPRDIPADAPTVIGFDPATNGSAADAGGRVEVRRVDGSGRALDPPVATVPVTRPSPDPMGCG